MALPPGAEGCLAHGPEGTFSIPAVPVAAGDATAAGDCFNGALACALGAGRPLRAALAWASRAASLAVARRGAQPSLPRRSEL